MSRKINDSDLGSTFVQSVVSCVTSNFSSADENLRSGLRYPLHRSISVYIIGTTLDKVSNSTAFERDVE